MSELIISVSGVRGVVGQTLTPQVACELGLSFAALLGGGGISGPVAVGRDSRPSGRMLEQALCAGLMGGGLTVRPLGIVPTPTCAIAVRDLHCVGGVMITASHNPAPYNGLKFMQSDGQCQGAQRMARLREIFLERAFAKVQAAHDAPFAVEPDSDAPARHVQKVLSIVDISGIRRARPSVLLDSVNGAGGVGTPQLLEALGCRVRLEHTEPSGRFPRPPEPTAENLADVARTVGQAGVDIGLVQDPDADRLALIDETGRYIGEEYTQVLAAQAVLASRPGPVATNLSASRMIDDVAKAAGVRVFRSPVGEANVAQEMALRECVMGGEGNGGVIDPRVVPVRDSLTGIALVLELMARTGKSLSRLVRDIPRYFMIKAKAPLPPGGFEQVLARVEALAEGGLINDADGIRIDWPRGWVHVRSSNTEPIYRIIAEADSDEHANLIVTRVKQAIG
ncbi:MAG: Phosphomannomutase/phosphoglucomutase [Phycisphaerae bacterium]|nr:Phosphomannomutase/phosphoglucomutase [Phycisphaerae bacterium]